MNATTLASTAPHDARTCVELCAECHRVCMATLAIALQKGSRPLDPEIARILLDCAQACDLTTDFVLRGSPFTPLVAEACAAIAEACANACSKAAGDGPLNACIAPCRACAESCRASCARPRA